MVWNSSGFQSAVEGALSELVGLRLSASTSVTDGRWFYFGDFAPKTDCENYLVLMLDSAWRIEVDQRVVVGACDYGCPGSELNPLQDLQTQLLDRFFGSTVDDYHLPVGRERIVRTFEVDVYGGFVMTFDDETRLRVFPCGAELQWMILRPDRQGSFMVGDCGYADTRLADPV